MQNLLTEYWWSITLVILVGGFYGLKFVAKSHAKQLILSYLTAAERLSFATADLKIGFVASASYAVLPKPFKAFIPYAMYSVLVDSLYADLKDLIEKLQADQAK